MSLSGNWSLPDPWAHPGSGQWGGGAGGQPFPGYADLMQRIIAGIVSGPVAVVRPPTISTPPISPTPPPPKQPPATEGPKPFPPPDEARGPLPPITVPELPPVVVAPVIETVGAVLGRIAPWVYAAWPQRTATSEEDTILIDPEADYSEYERSDILVGLPGLPWPMPDPVVTAPRGPAQRPRVIQAPPHIPDVRVIHVPTPIVTAGPLEGPKPVVLEVPFELPDVGPIELPAPAPIESPTATPVPTGFPDWMGDLLPFLPAIFAPFLAPGSRPGQLPNLRFDDDPLTPPYSDPLGLQQPLGFRPPTDECSCSTKPKSKKRKKKRRSVCYRGTYTERRNGLTKRKKEKVPCR